MKSPFPGMDPYVEPHWQDIHTALIGDARRALNQSLPPGLVARVEERVAVEADDQYVRRNAPDVRVFSPASADPDHGAAGVMIEAPFKLVVDLDPIIERFIRIIDQDGTLITVIEFLSPANKQSPGLADYHEKRMERLTAGVHVVEVDLVRAGDWRALMRPERCPADAVSTYRAVVRTSGARPAGYLFRHPPSTAACGNPHSPATPRAARSTTPPIALRRCLSGWPIRPDRRLLTTSRPTPRIRRRGVGRPTAESLR